MKRSTAMRNIAMIGAAAATIGCAALTRELAAPGTTCYPRKCFIGVQNDGGQLIGVRYQDSAGVGDVLGAVGPEGVRRFVLPRRTSRVITVVVSLDKRFYRSQVTAWLDPSEDIVHFPADFEEVAALLPAPRVRIGSR